ncbi:hypothetical protein FOT43_22305 [Serratia marcescens]|uniref:hypothetical protein n=1 Tax=Serratia marcescens TaxID=615 RepID=UPI00117C1753|nr:hypothetical protein [Serratia marcescens]TSB25824.1 hypothetical protein FOT43_22305 [Serratia marcescens]TXE44490.1 hypothetical protein FOT60_12370 [Serratia marcescens]
MTTKTTVENPVIYGNNNAPCVTIFANSNNQATVTVGANIVDGEDTFTLQDAIHNGRVKGVCLIDFNYGTPIKSIGFGVTSKPNEYCIPVAMGDSATSIPPPLSQAEKSGVSYDDDDFLPVTTFYVSTCNVLSKNIGFVIRVIEQDDNHNDVISDYPIYYNNNDTLAKNFTIKTIAPIDYQNTDGKYINTDPVSWGSQQNAHWFSDGMDNSTATFQSCSVRVKLQCQDYNLSPPINFSKGTITPDTKLATTTGLSLIPPHEAKSVIDYHEGSNNSGIVTWYVNPIATDIGYAKSGVNLKDNMYRYITPNDSAYSNTLPSYDRQDALYIHGVWLSIPIAQLVADGWSETSVPTSVSFIDNYGNTGSLNIIYTKDGPYPSIEIS